MEPVTVVVQHLPSPLEVWAAVFTILTGIVIAVAASFAYLVQRQRYLREATPDLEFTKALPSFDIIGNPPGGFTLSFEVSNRSMENTALDLKVSATVILTILDDFRDETPLTWPQPRLLPSREFARSNSVYDSRWNRLSGKSATIIVTLELQYSSEVPWFIYPSRRHTHRRSAQTVYQVDPDGGLYPLMSRVE